uniref:Protein scV3V2(G19S) n=1 Tax=Chlamydomonas reinhardtii TaxID=3055 RepID=UPI0001E5AD1F|nr:Chain A, Protein scV3V2(G19S) [Chlamydomonas reinhardtii]3MXA_A Chain A, scV3V2(G19S) [Chlamydomonas reinhardtii]
MANTKYNKEFLLYLAGFVDGDGSIIAQINPNQSSKFKHRLRLTFYVTQKTQRRWFLDKLVDEIGVGYVRDSGSVSQYVLSEIKPLHNFLTQLQPFLKLKQKQANLVLKIIEQLPSAKESPDKFLEVCTWVDQIAALNDSKTRKTTSETVRAVLDSLSGKKKSSPAAGGSDKYNQALSKYNQALSKYNQALSGGGGSNKEFLLYLAGFVDSDGSIIAQIKPRQSNKFKHQLSLTFAVTQKTQRRWFLDKLVDEIGVGYVYDSGSVSDYRLSEIKPLHNFLTQLQPFLKLKQKQANLVLKIIEQLPSAKESPDKFLEVCTWVDQIAALNDSKTRKTTSETVRAVLDSLSEKKKSSPLEHHHHHH